MESREMRAFRSMAWERAKGELKSIICTFYTEYNRDGTEQENGFKEYRELLEKFIQTVEDNGLTE